MTGTPEPAAVSELDLSHDTGIWAVRSISSTVYYVDLGTAEELELPYPLRAQLLRAPAATAPSATGPWDGVWLPLIDVHDDEGRQRVRVGHRHLWTMDPGPDEPDIWWWQRTVTAIEAIPPAERPPGRRPTADEANRPFRHG